jgi:membrane protease YdiL (CAAX protease family)
MDRRYDAVAVLQLVGAPVIFTGLWLLLARADFPAIASWINVLVSVVLAMAAVVLVLVIWARFGGYRLYRTLRRWVRGGPDPTDVPLAVRLRFLRQQSAGSFAGGWLFLAVGVLWLGLAIPELIEGQQRAVLYIATAALWAGGGASKILFVRHWGTRVEELIGRTESDLDGPEFADPTPSQ